MATDFVVIISALSVVNLFTLSVFSWVRSRQVPPYLWLGLLFFAGCSVILSNMLIYQKAGNFHLFGFAGTLNLSFGAFLHLFIHRLRHPEKTFTIKKALLFTPSIIYFCFVLYGLFDASFRDRIIYDAEYNLINPFTLISNIVIIVYSIGANIYELIAELRTSKPEQAEFKKAGKERIEMLSLLLVLQSAVFLPYLMQVDNRLLILYMPVLGQIYFFYMFFRLSQSTSVFIQKAFNEKFNLNENLITLKQNPKYSSIRMEKDKIDSIYCRILQLMEGEKIYLHMNLTISELAQKLHILPNAISMIINTRAGVNFPEFINQYRVKHAVILLEKMHITRQTIESIAFDSGFSNRTSFYAAFKKQTGKLPTEYVKNGSGENLLPSADKFFKE
jgi:AraC-like DNA-binding protein